MEAGLMEVVRSLNRSWIYDTYFSLYRAIHPGEKSGGMSEGNVRMPVQIHVSTKTHYIKMCLINRTILTQLS